MKRLARLLASAALVLPCIACGGSNEVVIEQEPLTPEQQQVNEQMRNMLQQSQTQMQRMRDQVPVPGQGAPAAPAGGQPAQ